MSGRHLAISCCTAHNLSVHENDGGAKRDLLAPLMFQDKNFSGWKSETSTIRCNDRCVPGNSWCATSTACDTQSNFKSFSHAGLVVSCNSTSLDPCLSASRRSAPKQDARELRTFATNMGLFVSWTSCAWKVSPAALATKEISVPKTAKPRSKDDAQQGNSY